MKSTNLSKIELAQNIGKLLLQNITVESDTDIIMQVSQQFIISYIFITIVNNLYIYIFFLKVCQLIKTRKDRKLTLEILLCILVQLYSVVDNNFEMSEERQIVLENMLGEAFFEDLEYLPEYLVKDLIGICSNSSKSNPTI